MVDRLPTSTDEGRISSINSMLVSSINFDTFWRFFEAADLLKLEARGRVTKWQLGCANRDEQMSNQVGVEHQPDQVML